MAVEKGILVATTNFWFGNQMITNGTTVRAGHPMAAKVSAFLEPLKIDFDHEEPPTSRHAKRDEPEKKEPPASPAPRSANVKFANPPTRKK